MIKSSAPCQIRLADVYFMLKMFLTMITNWTTLWWCVSSLLLLTGCMLGVNTVKAHVRLCLVKKQIQEMQHVNSDTNRLAARFFLRSSFPLLNSPFVCSLCVFISCCRAASELFSLLFLDFSEFLSWGRKDTFHSSVFPPSFHPSPPISPFLCSSLPPSSSLKTVE